MCTFSSIFCHHSHTQYVAQISAINWTWDTSEQHLSVTDNWFICWRTRNPFLWTATENSRENGLWTKSSRQSSAEGRERPAYREGRRYGVQYTNNVYNVTCTPYSSSDGNKKPSAGMSVNTQQKVAQNMTNEGHVSCV